MRPKPLMPIFIAAAAWSRGKRSAEHKSTRVDETCVLRHVLTAPAPLSAERARLMLKALAEPIRLQLIEVLGNGERCVCELTSELAMAQSKLSFHLRVLKEAGLLNAREEGRWVYYSLKPEALQELRTWLGDLASRCTVPASPCC
jgi:ArsR family transcriptional regulator